MDPEQQQLQTQQDMEANGSSLSTTAPRSQKHRDEADEDAENDLQTGVSGDSFHDEGDVTLFGDEGECHQQGLTKGAGNAQYMSLATPRQKKGGGFSGAVLIFVFLLGAVVGGLGVAAYSRHYYTNISNSGNDGMSSNGSVSYCDCISNSSSVSKSDSINNSDSVSSDDTDNDDDSSATIVSYAFLQTAKGKKVTQELTRIMVVDQSPRRALKKALEYMDQDEQINSSCHPTIHVLGRHTLHELGFEGAIRELRDEEPLLLRTCNAAFMHGVIETFLALGVGDPQSTTNDNEQPVSLLDLVAYVHNTLCTHIDDHVVPQGKWECNHGIGHGVLQYIRNRKIKEALVDGVAQCRAVARVEVKSPDCENGLWMDHFASTPVAVDLDPKTFLDVCQLASSDSIGNCFLYGPTEYLLHFPQDYEGAMKACEDSFSDDHEDDEGASSYIPVQQQDRYLKLCGAGVGTQALKEHLGDFHVAEQVCLAASAPNHQQYCFDHVMSFQIMATGQDYSASKMCAPLTHESFQKSCHSKARLP